MWVSSVRFWPEADPQVPKSLNHVGTAACDPKQTFLLNAEIEYQCPTRGLAARLSSGRKSRKFSLDNN
jgi:hypothetical protein